MAIEANPPVVVPPVKAPAKKVMSLEEKCAQFESTLSRQERDVLQKRFLENLAPKPAAKKKKNSPSKPASKGWLSCC